MQQMILAFDSILYYIFNSTLGNKYAGYSQI